MKATSTSEAASLRPLRGATARTCVTRGSGGKVDHLAAARGFAASTAPCTAVQYLPLHGELLQGQILYCQYLGILSQLPASRTNSPAMAAMEAGGHGHKRPYDVDIETDEYRAAAGGGAHASVSPDSSRRRVTDVTDDSPLASTAPPGARAGGAERWPTFGAEVTNTRAPDGPHQVQQPVQQHGPAAAAAASASAAGCSSMVQPYGAAATAAAADPALAHAVKGPLDRNSSVVGDTLKAARAATDKPRKAKNAVWPKMSEEMLDAQFFATAVCIAAREPHVMELKAKGIGNRTRKYTLGPSNCALYAPQGLTCDLLPLTDAWSASDVELVRQLEYDVKDRTDDATYKIRLDLYKTNSE